MNEQDIKKSIDQLVDSILKTESIEKAEHPTNGGFEGAKPAAEMDKSEEDKEPKAEEQSESKEEESEEAKKAKMKKAEEEKESAKEGKAEDKDDESKKSEEKEEPKKDEKAEDEKEEAKKSKMKKSLVELAQILDEDELELVKAWREDTASEQVVTSAQSQEEFSKSLTKVVTDVVEPLKKALEEKDSLIKSMSDKIEKMASQPAYDRRSITSLEALEKSDSASSNEISKSQVTDKMLELQIQGKGVTSHNIAEFEATGNISDPVIKSLVFKSLNLR